MIRVPPSEYEKEPTTAIFLHIDCKSLFKMDTFSPSDPLVEVYIRVDEKWEKFGETEKIENDENPSFAKFFEMEYFFERHQYLRFVVQDVDHVKSQRKLSLIGEMTCELSQIMV